HARPGDFHRRELARDRVPVRAAVRPPQALARLGTRLAPAGRMTPEVSVVVPTCGRPALLARCLEALARQSLPRDSYEVIVVEDRGRRGPAAARNRGWRRARAPIVAFTDDDCVPERDWLARGLEAMRGADAVCGRIVM